MFRYAVEALSGTSLMTASSDEAGDAGASSTGNNHNRNNADDEDEAPEHDDDDTTDGKIQLNGVTAVLSYGNEFQASKRVCKYLRNGITAIFGPMSASTSMHCTNICDAKEIPYVDFRWDANTKPPVINMMPHPDAMARVFVDLVRAWKWKGFTILYESGEERSQRTDARRVMLHKYYVHSISLRLQRLGYRERPLSSRCTIRKSIP